MANPSPPVGLKLNVGCGASPTPGFVNLDNSLTARLAAVPLLGQVLAALPLMGPAQRAFLSRARSEGIRWAEANALPFPDGAVSLVYSSHMIEHLTRDEAAAFLREAMRVLRPGGWVRVAAPDLGKLARDYVGGRFDANRFVELTLLAWERPRGALERLKLAVAGPRHHLWMYDGASLVRLFQELGFCDVAELPAGRTSIQDPGALDLAERAEESVYVEARKPETGAGLSSVAPGAISQRAS